MSQTDYWQQHLWGFPFLLYYTILCHRQITNYRIFWGSMFQLSLAELCLRLTTAWDINPGSSVLSQTDDGFKHLLRFLFLLTPTILFLRQIMFLRIFWGPCSCSVPVCYVSERWWLRISIEVPVLALSYVSLRWLIQTSFEVPGPALCYHVTSQTDYWQQHLWRFLPLPYVADTWWIQESVEIRVLVHHLMSLTDGGLEHQVRILFLFSPHHVLSQTDDGLDWFRSMFLLSSTTLCPG